MLAHKAKLVLELLVQIDKEDQLYSILREYFDEEESKKLAAAIQTGLPIVIDGVQGPTGKSALCTTLIAEGYNAAERWEMTKERDNNAANIVITLNRKIPLSEGGLTDIFKRR